MARPAKAVSVALVIAVMGLIGAGSPATAARPPAAHHTAHAEAATLQDMGDVWAKSRAFAECILRIGVPSALLILIATNPATWAWVVRGAEPPWIVTVWAGQWAEKIKSVCRYALLP
jgi:hypothetical protein